MITSEFPTADLRYVERRKYQQNDFGIIGYRPYNVLQQKWRIVTYEYGSAVAVALSEEWRDVPIESDE